MAIHDINCHTHSDPQHRRQRHRLCKYCINIKHLVNTQKCNYCNWEWLIVKDKLLFNDLVMVYKCLKNLTPGYLHRRFQYRAKTQQRVTRQNKDLTLPRYRLATGQKTFSYRGAKLYNSIAKDIRDTGNFIAFKYLFLLLKCKLPWKLTFIIIYRNSLFYHWNVNSFLVYFISFYFDSCMYGGRAPKGELGSLCFYFSVVECSIHR